MTLCLSTQTAPPTPTARRTTDGVLLTVVYPMVVVGVVIIFTLHLNSEDVYAGRAGGQGQSGEKNDPTSSEAVLPPDKSEKLQQ